MRKLKELRRERSPCPEKGYEENVSYVIVMFLGAGDICVQTIRLERLNPGTPPSNVGGRQLF